MAGQIRAEAARIQIPVDVPVEGLRRQQHHRGTRGGSEVDGDRIIRYQQIAVRKYRERLIQVESPCEIDRVHLQCRCDA